MNIEALTTIKNYLLLQDPVTYDQDLLGIGYVDPYTGEDIYDTTVTTLPCGCTCRSAALALGMVELKLSVWDSISTLLQLTPAQYTYIFGYSYHIKDLCKRYKIPEPKYKSPIDAANRIEDIIENTTTFCLNFSSTFRT